MDKEDIAKLQGIIYNFFNDLMMFLENLKNK